MPRLLDDSEDENEEISSTSATPNPPPHQLVRSPSDTSLMYLSQLSSFFASAEETKKPSLPCKKRTRAIRICAAAAALQVQPPPQENAEEEERQREAIYDCLPKPRTLLSEEQIRFNEIYDVPRNLLISPKPPCSSQDYFPRSVSAFSRAQTTTNPSHLRQSECVSVCSAGQDAPRGRGGRPLMQELNGLNRHRNYVDDLHKDPSAKPALPPKSRKGFYGHDIYDNPRNLMMNSDCISLCSNFSYCSHCTNTDSNLELTDSSASGVANTIPSSLNNPPVANNDGDSLRFSPTSLFSEDSVSLRDFDFDMPYLEHIRGSRAEYSCGGSSGKMIPEMSTLSSVSSVTLQGDDLSVDTISLPEDPFPNGLPSSASSTIGSDQRSLVSSRYVHTCFEKHKHSTHMNN